MMAMLYASKICMEAKNPKTKKPWEFADVPPKLKQQVADILINECGLPELVPAEYGGTKEKPESEADSAICIEKKTIPTLTRGNNAL